MNIIYTIGHSTVPVEDFVKLLQVNNINVVADVRSTPYSQYASQFNKEAIAKRLKDNGIKYLYLGEEFGARRDSLASYTDGQVDFEKVAQEESFLKGVDRVRKGINLDYTIALMCAEKDPIECHRCILVGHYLDEHDFNVKHILCDGSCIDQSDINAELLDEYFPNRNQLSIFGNESDAELLKEAYLKQSKKIAYKKEQD